MYVRRDQRKEAEHMAAKMLITAQIGGILVKDGNGSVSVVATSNAFSTISKWTNSQQDFFSTLLRLWVFDISEDSLRSTKILFAFYKQSITVYFIDLTSTTLGVGP